MSKAVMEAPCWTGQETSEESPDSFGLAELLRKAFAHLIEPASSTRPQIMEEIASVEKECAEPGWDGDGTLPVGAEAASAIRLFIQGLPLGIPLPDDVVPEPGGGLGLEWSPTPGRSLIVSSDGDGLLSYSLLLDGEQIHDTILFFETVPSQLLYMIERLYR